MEFYIDVRVNPDEEMRENVLLNKVYTKLHKALNTLSSTTIGVSFPERFVKLGKVLRIHGSDGDLRILDEMKWLGGLVGYCDVSAILNVPNEVKYQVIFRVQPNMTQSKLRRLMKRGSISDVEQKHYKAKMFTQGLDEAYLELDSATNGHSYRRYLSFSAVQDVPITGLFDDFGLSKKATVPVF